MYAESLGSRKTLGDVDILYHDGLYHLFHLVLPNHDFIAHAVSSDGLAWQRVENALFIGHPGSWDDSMLWTMHVSRDPHVPGQWRMFYTGLSRDKRGQLQRIGLAVSEDLYHWKKCAVNWKDHRRTSTMIVPSDPLADSGFDPDSCFPISPDPNYYESSVKEGRHWISWRDPFYYHDGKKGWLLCAGRIKQGPITRRGCVALLEEIAPNKFEARDPLHYPGLYDDIEVPNLIRKDGEYFLIGSLREDAKIRYWHTNEIGKPWRSYHDNVLLAAGNYAGRICHDDKGILIWNFFTPNAQDRTVSNLMPPPKRLVRTPNGLLRAQTFEALRELAVCNADVSQIAPLKCSHFDLEKNGLECEWIGDKLRLSSESGFEAFVFAEIVNHFRLAARIQLSGLGKCGLVFRLNPDTHDGYYLSLDLLKGLAQLRAWGTGAEASGEHMMQFSTLQTGNWFNEHASHIQIELICFGSYLELSVDGRVILSLADQTYDAGKIGFYAETAKIDICELELQHLRSPTQSDEHLTEG